MQQYIFNIIPFRENSVFDFDLVHENLHEVTMKVPCEKLFPFQLRLPSSFGAITVVKLTDYKGTIIDLSADIAEFDVKTGPSFKQLIFNGDTDLTAEIPCGLYQLTISDGTLTYVSEWFTCVAEDSLSFFEFYQAVDFDNFSFYDGWKNRLYFDKTPSKAAPFYEEKISNKNGTITYIYQNYADRYEIIFFAPKDTASALHRLQLYESVFLYLIDFDETQIVDRIETTAETLENSRIYRVTVNYKQNKLEKSQCDTPPRIINNWILITTDWRDEGIWIDVEFWYD